MIEEIIDQTWWILEQLLTDHFEELVEYAKNTGVFFALLKKENTKLYLSSVYNHENMTIAHGQT